MSALHLFLRCGPWVLALPTAGVERILLPEEARLHPAPPFGSALPPGGLGILALDDRRFAAWDLGLMLGLGPQSDAWVLLTLDRNGRSTPIALRTDECQSVSPLEPAALRALPAAAFLMRPGLFVAAFRGKDRRNGDALGLAIDISRLFRSEDAAYAEAVLSQTVPA